MKSDFFNKEHLLTKIIMYLKPEDILSFSSCNKAIYKKLNPCTNIAINITFCRYTNMKCFEMEGDYNKIHEIDLIDNCWKSNINWKLYLVQINKHFKEYPDIEISKKVLDVFRTKLYLNDLRKENPHLEYFNSSCHQLFCYDWKFRETCNSNYYGHFINNNYIQNRGMNCKEIKILRENLPFEYELKNFINVYFEIKKNKEYKDVIDNIINYNFENLEKIYENAKNNVNKINKIIYFLLWLNKSLIVYSVNTYESIIRFQNDKDCNTFLNDFNDNYNNFTNVSLLLNQNFQNINIIINYLNMYIMNNNTICYNFSIYELARNIFKKKVYDKVSETVLQKTTILLNKYKFDNINEISNQDENNNDSMDCEELNETDESSNMSFFEIDEEKNDKEILENIINNLLDININKYNANAINHSLVKLSTEYEQIENLVNEKFCQFIQEKLNEEKPALELFEIIEKTLESNKNEYFLVKQNSSTLKVINRTRKNLLKGTFKTMCNYILPNILKDFNSHLKINNDERQLQLNAHESMYKNSYKCDLSNLSNKSKMEIEAKVKEEINNIKSCIYEKNIKGYNVNETIKLVNEYMDNDGIEIVLLVKKMIYFYFKEMQIYEEKDKKIFNILSGQESKEYLSNNILNNMN